MELMSSLLLCALATLVPLALGKNSTTFVHTTGINEFLTAKNSSARGINTNIKSLPLPNKESDMQSVFMDSKCKICLRCMERAIALHKVNSHISTINDENFQNEVVNRKINIRDKRKSTESMQDKGDKKTKKSKPKNNKSVSIIKYNENERIYALKIMESNTQVLSDKRNTNKTKTCKVYSVKKSFPCESPEADLILKESKRKINKKSTKKHKREKNVPDAKATVIAPVFRKRQIDDSQAPEQIMPSIEELY